MDNVRRRVYEIIEVAREDDKASFWYDMLMLLTIVVSILPLAFKKRYWIFQYTDEVTTGRRPHFSDILLRPGPSLTW